MIKRSTYVCSNTQPEFLHCRHCPLDNTLADEFPSQDNILALTKMELPFFKVVPVSKLICTSSILMIVTPVEDEAFKNFRPDQRPAPARPLKIVQEIAGELRSLTHALYGCAPEVEYRSWADADARLSRWIVRLFDYP